jgi:hypothetical protein
LGRLGTSITPRPSRFRLLDRLEVRDGRDDEVAVGVLHDMLVGADWDLEDDVEDVDDDVTAPGASRPQVSQKPSSSISPPHPLRGHALIGHLSAPAKPAGTG